MAATIVDQFGSRERFMAVLVAAELNARNPWECEFTDDMRDSYERHGSRMRISKQQRQQLRRIAGE